MSRSSRGSVVCVLVLVGAMLGAACGSSGSAKPAATTTSASKLRGPLTVFAASSLTEAFTDEKAALAGRDPALKLAYSFAGSQALVQQIEQGAPADVFASTAGARGANRRQ